VTFGLGNRCSILLSYGTGASAFSMFARALPDKRGALALAAALLWSAPVLACPDEHPTEARVTEVDERLELTLEDGRRVKLAGVEAPRATPADPARPADIRARLAHWLVGLPVGFRFLATEPDRWGRLPARARADAPDAEPEAARLDVAAALLGAGSARFAPHALLGDCRAGLVAAEAAARGEKLGLWADPAYAVVSGGDRAGFVGRGGQAIVVEGRVTRVGTARYRTYLNFGPIRGQDFAVTILKRNRATFETAGVLLAALNGRRIRVRGLLETRYGPQIEIASPGEMDLIDEPAKPPAGAGDDAGR
jgi:endonuclease YncB( thermonuclease family)